MGAVAWAMRQRSVSHPRSSNRTCRFPASGSPTGFTVRHAARGTKVGVRGATPRVLHRRRWRRTGVCHAPSSCAVARGSRARAHRRSSRYPGMPPDAFHRRSSAPTQTGNCSVHRATGSCGGLRRAIICGAPTIRCDLIDKANGAPAMPHISHSTNPSPYS
jgi:hypothetical protein